MSFPAKYEPLLELWEKDGLPNDASTRQVACEDVLPTLWREYKSLRQSLRELTASPQDTRYGWNE